MEALTKVCSICGKSGCHNANPNNLGLGTTRPCVKLNVGIGTGGQPSKELVIKKVGKVGMGNCSHCGTIDYQCGCKLEVIFPKK